MYKQLKVICGKIHNANKFPYLKRFHAGKFVEPFLKFQSKDSFICSLFLYSIPKLSIFIVLLLHNSGFISAESLMDA